MFYMHISVLFVWVKRLFNSMTEHGLVPDGFGQVLLCLWLGLLMQVITDQSLTGCGSKVLRAIGPKGHWFYKGHWYLRTKDP
jgi:hypothetical protein